MSWLFSGANKKLTGFYPCGQKQFQFNFSQEERQNGVTKIDFSGVVAWSFQVREENREQLIALSCSLNDSRSESVDWMVDTDHIVRIINQDNPDKNVAKHGKARFSSAYNKWRAIFEEISEEFMNDGNLTFNIEIGIKSVSENIRKSRVCSPGMIFVVGGEKFYTTKEAIRSHSMEFEDMIKTFENMPDCDDSGVPISDTDRDVFRVFIQFINGFAPSIQLEHIELLLKLAERFNVPSVKNYCERQLSELTEDEVTIIKLAEQFQLSILDSEINKVKSLQVLKQVLKGYRSMRVSTVTKLVHHFTKIA